MIDDFSIDRISSEFHNADFTLCYIGQICESDNDAEAIEDTIGFVGMKWTDVSPEMLRKCYTAFSFFTEMAFFLFFPSVIASSIKDPLRAHLAVGDVLSTLYETGSDQLDEFYGRKWKMFSPSQIQYVICWLSLPEAPFLEYFDSSEIDRAVKSLNLKLIDAVLLSERGGAK